jgi:hypothetical protein
MPAMIAQQRESFASRLAKILMIAAAARAYRPEMPRALNH